MIHQCLFCMPPLCSPERVLTVQCTAKEESCLFKELFAVNHVNQVIRGTREILWIALACLVL